MSNRPIDDETDAVPFALVGETDFGALTERDDRLRAIEDQLAQGSRRMDALERSAKETRDAVEDGNDVTREIRDWIKSGKTIFNAVSWGGKAFTKIAVLAGKFAGAGLALYGVYWAITHPGSAPPK